MSKDRRAYMREYHARRRELTAANGGVAPTGGHGSVSTATNWRCQCGPCQECRAERNRINKANRLAQTVANGGIAPVAAHGVRSTYTDWGCTCDDCRTAASAYNREWRQSRRTRGDRKVAS